MDKQMVPSEIAPLKYVFRPLVQPLAICISAARVGGKLEHPHLIDLGVMSFCCFAYSFGVTQATVKWTASSERAHLHCVFHLLLRLLMSCISGAGAGRKSHLKSYTADEIFWFQLQVWNHTSYSQMDDARRKSTLELCFPSLTRSIGEVYWWCRSRGNFPSDDVPHQRVFFVSLITSAPG